MNQSELRRYAHFYRNARHLEVDALLRGYLGMPADFIFPLNVPHGVDFGFSREGFDIYKPEPIYWATNPHIAALARHRKPVFAAPHPFILAMQRADVPAGAGVLVIGPPPGLENDRNLLDLIVRRRDCDPAETSILIKPSRYTAQSTLFWRDAGFSTLSFKDATTTGYHAMVETLARFETVISGNVSSATFFAAALGKRIALLRGYQCRAYEGLHIKNTVDFAAPEAARAVRALDSADPAEATASALDVLGNGYDCSPDQLRAQLLGLIENLTLPLFVRHRIPPAAKRLLIDFATLANRPSLLSTSIGEFLRGRLTSAVLIQDIDEVSLWLDGPNAENLRLSKVRYVRHEREPGMAVIPYRTT